jgi:formylglycine-generating enzyme required for sulfatase activity
MKKILVICSVLLVVVIVTVGLPMLSRIKKASLKMAAEQQRQVDAWEVPPADESGSLDDANTLADDDGKTSSESLDEASDPEGTSDTALPTEQAAEPTAEQPTEQPQPIPSDLRVIELPSITNTIGMTFKKIPAGTFMMGSPETEKDRADDEHQHKVTISKAFYMQTTEVTQGQWKAIMGTDPWKGEDYVKEGANYPAMFLSWDDAVAYCKQLSAKEGKTYRLPTEAEWEYACRAGTQTTWSFGNNEASLDNYAWHFKNAWDAGEQYAHQVGLKKPNAFGLYDMHGNVYEWCNDYYAEDYYKQSPEKDPTSPVSGSFRVLRGGCWGHEPSCSRSALRNTTRDAANRGVNIGFRLTRELD